MIPMTKRNIARCITAGAIACMSIALIWDIYLIKKRSPDSIVDLVFIVLTLIAFVYVPMFRMELARIWDIIFWPFIADTEVKYKDADYERHYLASDNVVGLTYVGGEVGQTFYFNKDTFCNIRMYGDGKMKVITGPKVVVSTFGSDVVKYKPLSFTITEAKRK